MSIAVHAVRESNRSARIKRSVIRVLEYLALFLACFIALLPIWSSFTTSFKSAEEYASTNAMALPRNWLNFGNYAQVWTEGDMLRAFLTSASVVIVVVAYMLSKLWKGCSVIFLLLVALVYILSIYLY